MGRRRGGFGALAKGIVARRARSAPPVPAPGNDLTLPDTRPWHVRTIILPIPGPGGVSLVFANLMTGLTGIRGFDDRPVSSDARNEGTLDLVADDFPIEGALQQRLAHLPIRNHLIGIAFKLRLVAIG